MNISFLLKKKRKEEISPRDSFVGNIFLNQDEKDKVVGLGQLTLFRRLFFLINVSNMQTILLLFIHLFIYKIVPSVLFHGT